MTDGAKRDFKVRALGEIAIRCADLERMAAFYQDIIGLEHLYGDHRDGIIFSKSPKGSTATHPCSPSSTMMLAGPNCTRKAPDHRRRVPAPPSITWR